MNKVPYSLRYLPLGVVNGEVKHLLPYEFSTVTNEIVYGKRDHTFQLFDSIIEHKAWQDEKVEWVEIVYGGSLKTPNEQGIFTRVDGGQRVKKWQQGQKAPTMIWDPEPEPAAPTEIPEPDDITLGDDEVNFTIGNNTNNFTVGSDGNVTIEGNLVVNGTITVEPSQAASDPGDEQPEDVADNEVIEMVEVERVFETKHGVYVGEPIRVPKNALPTEDEEPATN